MSVTIDNEQLIASLTSSAAPVEVRSPSGRILGTFIPRPPEPELSDEELDRIIADPATRWYTAAEVEARMREWRCSP